MLTELGKRAKNAEKVLMTATTAQKNAALENAVGDILTANEIDIKNARENGMKESLIDRLALTEKRVLSIASATREVINLPDPIGKTLSGSTRPNGLVIEKVTVPLGVVAPCRCKGRPSRGLHSAR